jgi:hypothetical protein
MTYKIISTRTVDATLFTQVEFNINGDIYIEEIAHFMPQNEEEVTSNILAAGNTLLVKVQSINTIANLIGNLPIGEVKPLE